MSRLLAAPAGAPEKGRLFDLLCDEIEAHDAAEEQTLYAELLAQTKDQRIVRRCVDAHDEAARLIGELSDIPADDEAWRNGLARLDELLAEHHHEQESEAFALAGSLISDDQADRLQDAFDRAKRNWFDVFGRVPPAERQPAAAVARGDFVVVRRAAGLLMRGRPGGWFKRIRRPLRGAGFPRPASASPLSDSTPPRHLGGPAGKALKRSRSL